MNTNTLFQTADLIDHIRGIAQEGLSSRWREIDERSKIEAKMFEKAEFTWGK